MSLFTDVFAWRGLDLVKLNSTKKMPLVKIKILKRLKKEFSLDFISGEGASNFPRTTKPTTKARAYHWYCQKS